MHSTVRLVIALAVAILASACGEGPERTSRLDFAKDGAAANRGPARGPLRALAENPRYFTDGSGKAIFLTGSHTWDNRQDIGSRPFAWAEYLARLEQYHHNFVRLWVWEQPKGLTTGPDPLDPTATVAPELFSRAGPGVAADGGLKFDLTRYNAEHFGRLRQRVIDARDHGIYVSIMLFNGWSIERKAGGGDPWTYHPFNRENNANGVDGDPDRSGRGVETHTLRIPAVTRIQEAYVRKVLDTVGDLDDVLYEISNESGGESQQWRYHMIGYVKGYEATKAKQHPVGMTATWPDGSNGTLSNSPADWISPNQGGGYADDPPAASGGKVILSDTDHLWGIGGNRSWAWKSFTRGLNVIYMDPWEARVIPVSANPDLRANIGIRAVLRPADESGGHETFPAAGVFRLLSRRSRVHIPHLPAGNGRWDPRALCRAGSEIGFAEDLSPRRGGLVRGQWRAGCRVAQSPNRRDRASQECPGRGETALRLAIWRRRDPVLESRECRQPPTLMDLPETAADG